MGNIETRSIFQYELETPSTIEILLYDDFKLLFGQIGGILVGYYSMEMLDNFERSNILNKQAITYTMRYNVFTNGSMEQRVKDFVKDHKFPYIADGVDMSAFHINIFSIKNFNLEIDDNIIADFIRNNLKKTQNKTNESLSDIISFHTNTFNEYINANKENKELTVIYYPLFRSIAQKEWSTEMCVNNKEEDEKILHLYRSFFKGYGFNHESRGESNGCNISVELNYINIKQYWIELFAKIHLLTTKHVNINKIHTSYTMPAFYDVEKIKVDVKSEKVGIDQIIQSDHYFKTGEKYIKGIFENVLLNGCIDFEYFYKMKGERQFCYGNPVGMAYGEMFLIAKLQSPKHYSHVTTISFWMWRLGYDDLW